MRYLISKEEQEYLSKYKQEKYDRPSIAADIVVFTVGKEEVLDTRQLPVKKLRVLLIKRGSYPYKGAWALPGGFCRKNEEVYETARRELFEETNIRDAYLKLSGIYSDIDRDPRGWMISQAFLALMDGEKCNLRADTDAWDAKWFDVEVDKSGEEKLCEKDKVIMRIQYDLVLKNDRLRFVCRIAETRIYENYHEKISYEILESDGIAFDHAKIILDAFQKLQKSAGNDVKIVFDLMPEQFTLTELQNVFEIILQKELLKPNFRRKIADYVIETENVQTGRRHRTAKQYRRNVEKFYEM